METTSLEKPAQFELLSLKGFHGQIWNPLPRETRASIQGRSWTENCPLSMDELAYLQVDHYTQLGTIEKGELIIHHELASEMLDIFSELFEAQFPIEQMRLIEHFDCDDNRSMAANNSYCFCTRPIVGQRELSKHSYGCAIDINPRVNPYHREGKILPPEGEAFLNRQQNIPGMIQEGSPCHQAFAKRGYTWGGNWPKPYLDYHHFEKPVP